MMTPAVMTLLLPLASALGKRKLGENRTEEESGSLSVSQGNTVTLAVIICLVSILALIVCFHITKLCRRTCRLTS